ncbi:hypothetical protein [Nocardia mexicana]|uniref:hypothetical protein n=1 Tax=Nocardia mexicana TaxID=279262 RepID=UPI001FE7C140|nr:hypothetical protein [Nocardia mexicana]
MRSGTQEVLGCAAVLDVSEPPSAERHVAEVVSDCPSADCHVAPEVSFDALCWA